MNHYHALRRHLHLGRQRWQLQMQRLPVRSRLLVQICGIVLGSWCFYGLIMLPAQAWLKVQQEAYFKKQSQYEWLKNRQSLLEKNQALPTGNIEASLVSLVTTTAQAVGLQVSRYDPKDENVLRVWIENVAFDQLLTGLTVLLQQRQMRIRSIQIHRDSTQGKVDAMIELQRMITH